jgi:hypothetical protein
MRAFLHAMVVMCLAAGVYVGTQGQGGDATRVLAATREALGGEQKLAAVKTFVATGRTRQIRGNNLVPIEFEIACELPDKYVRRDEIPAQESGPTSAGFSGDSLIQLPPPPPPPPTPSAPTAKPAVAPAAAPGAANPIAVGASPSGPPGAAGTPPSPPPDPRKARVTSIKQDFVRLTLGMFAASFGSYPLTFTLDGQAEAPQGKADIVGVRGAGTFALKFFVNSETHLPIMVSWTMPATNVVLVVPGQPAPENLPPGSIKVDAPAPPGATATKEEQGNYAAAIQDLRKKALTGAKPIEYRIYYADYRDVGNGLKFPFRLRRAIATETVEETNFDTFKINARIDPRKFEVVK